MDLKKTSSCEQEFHRYRLLPVPVFGVLPSFGQIFRMETNCSFCVDIIKIGSHYSFEGSDTEAGKVLFSIRRAIVPHPLTQGTISIACLATGGPPAA
jgi:hypothetical protein